MENTHQIRKEVADKMAFLQLCSSLMKEMANEGNLKKTKDFILMLNDFVANSSDEEVITKGSNVVNLVDQLCQTAMKQFPPKKSLSEIAEAYNKYCREFPGHASEYGISYGWLNNQLDCKKLYNEPIPAHSKVGTFYHAGKFIIEESIILRDAFFFLVKAEIELKKLDDLVKLYEGDSQKPTDEERTRSYVNNANVGTYCRTSLLTFYSFIEAYVNCMGLDYLYTHESQLTEKEKEILQGKDGNNYLSLEKKLEKFHEIIRPDKKKQFVTTSKQQQKEPFITFLNECKEIRNSSVHYSPTKARIIRRPHEWYDKVTQYGHVTLEVAKVFWNACYENKKYPDYLDILDFEILKGLAHERIAEKAN